MFLVPKSARSPSMNEHSALACFNSETSKFYHCCMASPKGKQHRSGLKNSKPHTDSLLLYTWDLSLSLHRENFHLGLNDKGELDWYFSLKKWRTQPVKGAKNVVFSVQVRLEKDLAKKTSKHQCTVSNPRFKSWKICCSGRKEAGQLWVRTTSWICRSRNETSVMV